MNKFILLIVLFSANVSAGEFYIGGNLGYSWGALQSIDELGQNQFMDENPFYHFTVDDDYSSMATGLHVGYQFLPSSKVARSGGIFKLKQIESITLR